jgi:hypothetical protein
MYPPINTGVQKRISEEYKREYERLRGSIYEYLRHRVDFVGAVGSPLVKLAARLFANWLYVEKLLTNEGKTAVWKYADALARIHSMLLTAILQVLTRIDSQLDRLSHFVRSQTYVFDLG